MKLYGCKKGSLNLSINAIVVLILAITMLGLGLSFMKNIFGGATEEFEKVGGTVEKQMIEQMKESANIIELSRPSIDIKKAGKDQIFIAMKNVQSESEQFKIITPDKSDLGDCGTSCPCDGITLKYKKKETTVASGVSTVLPINVEAGSNAIEGTCFVDIVICQASSVGTADGVMSCDTGETEHHAELTIDVIV